MELKTNNAKESNCLKQFLGKIVSALIHSQAFSILHYSLIKPEIKLSTSVHGNNYLQLCLMFHFWAVIKVSMAPILAPTLFILLDVHWLKNSKVANFPCERPPQLKQSVASGTSEERNTAWKNTHFINMWANKYGKRSPRCVRHELFPFSLSRGFHFFQWK